MKLSKQIQQIFDRDGEISLAEILENIKFKSFGILLVIFSLPSAIPIPAPGYSIPFGLALIYLAKDIIKKRPSPKFSERILEKKIKTKKNSFLLKTMVWFLSLFENFLKPRNTEFFKKNWFVKLLGWLVLICGITMLSPVPLTNTLSALSIFIIGLAFLEEDAWFGFLGIITAITAIISVIIIHILVMIFGLVIIEAIKNTLFEWLMNN